MSRVEGELRWLAGILSGGEDSGVAPSVAAGGPEGLVVVPGAARPRLVVPTDRRVAAAALRNHAALRSPAVHAARLGLAGAFATGAPQAVFRDRLVFPGDRGAAPLVRHLREVLGMPGLEIAVALGPPAPNRKPVLQLLAPSGAPVGFAKVGWNAFTVPLVKNEAATLEGVTDARLQTLEAPRVMHHGPWRGSELLVTSPLPPDARRYGESAPALFAASEVGTGRGMTTEALGDSAYWRQLRTERASRAAADLRSSFEAIEDRFGSVEMAFGDWHGDWAPWNLAHARGKLWAIDWEHARRGVPVGLDVVHFRFQVEFLRRKRPIPEAADRAAASADVDLARLALPEEPRRVLPILHLIEIWLRAEDARRLGAGVNPRVYPAIAEEVRRRTTSLTS
ncbi:MAG: hypothetical protein ACRDJP_12250 [Actinomycetota bacterium]